MALEIHYGPPVTGPCRYPRPDLERNLLRAIRTSSGVKMFGLRRIGKSTLRTYLIEQLEARGDAYTFVDAQGITSLNMFFGQLLRSISSKDSIWERVKGKLAASPLAPIIEGLAAGTKAEDKTLEAYWLYVSDAVKAALKENRGHILIIDEFSYMLQGIVQNNGAKIADQFLATLREWRSGGMTMLLTGSLGVQAICRQYKLNAEHLNDLDNFIVPELSEAEARDFIAQATATSSGKWTEDHTDALLLETYVLYPCFLVLGLIKVNHHDPISLERFEDVFAEDVRPQLHDTFLAQFDRRLKMYKSLPNNEHNALILPILCKILADENGCADTLLPRPKGFDESARRDILTVLVEDGFISARQTRDGARHWRAASRLVTLWWKHSGVSQ